MNRVFLPIDENLTVTNSSSNFLSSAFLHSKLESSNFGQEWRRCISGGSTASWKNGMSDALESVENIVVKLSILPNSSLFESSSSHAVEQLRQVEDRLPRALFLKAKELFQSLVQNVEDGHLSPSGKHGVQISKFLERILVVYNHVAVIRYVSNDNDNDEKISVYYECMEILRWMELWNLNRSSHYEYAISCACHEDRFDDAANLFWTRIDPEAGANPTTVSVINPLGLYAIARSCQRQQLPAVQHVFEAVLCMSMVSPRDQTTYLLAAGVALGHADEWEAAVQYIRRSSSVSQLGVAVVAGVMRSCIMCNRPKEALEIYDEFVSTELDMSSEWQWGGGRDRINPLCRDLSMQAMATLPGHSHIGVERFRQAQKEDVTISQDALLGIIGACECDGDWEEAAAILLVILDNYGRSDWIVPASAMMISDRETVSSIDVPSKSPTSSLDATWLGHILASVMRTCNSSSNYGVSLLLCRLVDIGLPSAAEGSDLDYSKHTRDDGSDATLEESLTPLFFKMKGANDAFLSSTMQSLCGLGCFRSAASLFEVWNARIPDSNMVASRGLYEKALDEIGRRREPLIGNSWYSANRHVHRLTAAIHELNSGKTTETMNRDRERIENALAAAMHACTDARQPQMSLYLALWTIDALYGSDQKFRVNDAHHLLLVCENDLVLAEIIHAYQSDQNFGAAREAFEYLLSTHPTKLSLWKLSCTAGISILVSSGGMDDAIDVFDQLGESGLTTDAFAILAKGLLQQKRWTAVYELYRTARGLGCLSEELGLMAMKAIVNSSLSDKLSTLRDVVDDMADAAGVDPVNWMESRYFYIKRSVGFRYVCSLLWWTDPDTCHFDELNLALEEFEKRKLSGLSLTSNIAWLIVEHAKSFHSDYVPDGRKELPRVPRTKPEWVDLVNSMLDEARQTTLLHNPMFLEDVKHGLENLGCDHDRILSVHLKET